MLHPAKSARCHTRDGTLSSSVRDVSPARRRLVGGRPIATLAWRPKPSRWERAAEASPTRRIFPLRKVAPPRDAPLQGVFTYNIRADGSLFWKDDDGEQYGFSRNTDDPRRMWLLATNGREVLVEFDEKWNGELVNEADPVSPMDLEFETFDPTLVEGDDLLLSMDLEPPTKGETFESGQPSYQDQFDSDERFANFRNPRLQSPLTVRSVLIPLEVGEPFDNDFAYEASQVIVAVLQVKQCRQTCHAHRAEAREIKYPARKAYGRLGITPAEPYGDGRAHARVGKLRHLKAAFRSLKPVSAEAKDAGPGDASLRQIGAIAGAGIPLTTPRV